MRPPRRSSWGAALAALVIASLVEARTATLHERAKLRSGPSVTADLVGELPVGTTVEVQDETAGWLQVQTGDGQTGYLWGQHVDGAVPVPKAVDATAPPTTRNLADEVHALRDELGALRERPEPATAADVERLRTEVGRLASTHQELARRLEEHPASMADPSEATIGLTLVLIVVGIAIGWAFSRLFQSRRSYRHRDRLRL